MKIKECLLRHAIWRSIESGEIYDAAGMNALDVLYANPIKWAFEMERYTREVETLAKDKERVETELNIGRDIQMQMLPKDFPVRSGYDIN